MSHGKISESALIPGFKDACRWLAAFPMKISRAIPRFIEPRLHSDVPRLTPRNGSIILKLRGSSSDTPDHSTSLSNCDQHPSTAFTASLEVPDNLTEIDVHKPTTL
ncbi:unnamed protein product [Closterium sp. Yama58-4]|nr:unnamed protein product [Closterium sp. Yama58-4]